VIGYPAKVARRRLSLTLDARAMTALDELVRTGLHGVDRAGVAREMILRGLREAAATGFVAIPIVAKVKP